MKLKEIRKDTKNEITIYSGIKDIFGGACELWVNELTHSYRLKAKNKTYVRECRKLKSMKLPYIVPQKYLDVIDIDKETADFLKHEFSGYFHPEFSIYS